MLVGQKLTSRMCTYYSTLRRGGVAATYRDRGGSYWGASSPKRVCHPGAGLVDLPASDRAKQRTMRSLVAQSPALGAEPATLVGSASRSEPAPEDAAAGELEPAHEVLSLVVVASDEAS